MMKVIKMKPSNFLTNLFWGQMESALILVRMCMFQNNNRIYLSQIQKLRQRKRTKRIRKKWKTKLRDWGIIPNLFPNLFKKFHKRGKWKKGGLNYRKRRLKKIVRKLLKMTIVYLWVLPREIINFKHFW